MAKEYSGLKGIVQENIVAGWKEYKSLFGLEGQKVHEAIQGGFSQNQIEEIVRNHRTEREQLIVDWEKKWLKSKC